MPSEYVKDLVDHKQRVAGYMQLLANDLFWRSARHDNSKFSDEEFEAYEEAFPELQKYAYGTPEFKAALEKIRPAVEHHYHENDHHPEYHNNGVNDMTLVQLMEMLCDWLAASERSQVSFARFLEGAKGKYGIDEQLFAIICQTVVRYAPHKLPDVQTDPKTLYPDVLF